MIKAKIEITVIVTDSDRIRIVVNGGSYAVPDIIENIGITSCLEVEAVHSKNAEFSGKHLDKKPSKI